MTATKERIIGAVSIMSDKDADIFWRIIQNHFTAPDLFANIEDTEPDETDLAMLKEIEHNPDCHEFISQEELMKELMSASAAHRLSRRHGAFYLLGLVPWIPALLMPAACVRSTSSAKASAVIATMGTLATSLGSVRIWRVAA